MGEQCPSCGGFCKKSGCERENTKLEREWVGLSDEEIAEYWGDTHAGNTRYVQSFARALEATLKEKNGG